VGPSNPSLGLFLHSTTANEEAIGKTHWHPGYRKAIETDWCPGYRKETDWHPGYRKAIETDWCPGYRKETDW
jgi:hypothetical protein